MRHSLPLDGIRAIAVVLVVLFHYGYLAAGWIGVQVFFTLSGFLITSILLQAKQKSFLDFVGNFYWHRALRILPLLYFFLLVTGIAYLAFGSPASFPFDGPWIASFTSNFARMRPNDLGSTLVHMWSLAVEQQFYLIWPVLIFFVSPRAFRAVVAALLIVTPFLRLALYEWLTLLGHPPLYAGKAVYVLPFAQFDAFAAGAAIPLWGLDRINNAGKWLVAVVALAAIAGFGVLVSEYFSTGAFISSLGYPMFLPECYGYAWGYTLLNAVSSLSIICALQGKRPSSLLTTKPLVWLGKISYGIYVYHLPLLVLGRFLAEKHSVNANKAFGVPFFLAWVACVLVVSAVSFRWIESPFLKFKHYWRDAAVPTR